MAPVGEAYARKATEMKAATNDSSGGFGRHSTHRSPCQHACQIYSYTSIFYILSMQIYLYPYPYLSIYLSIYMYIYISKYIVGSSSSNLFNGGARQTDPKPEITICRPGSVLGRRLASPIKSFSHRLVAPGSQPPFLPNQNTQSYPPGSSDALPPR